MYLIINAVGEVVCATTDPSAYVPVGHVLVDTPEEFDPALMSEYLYVDGAVTHDPAIALNRAKLNRIEEIKRQAAANISALQWRVERAQERERLGLPGETVEQVLLEREAIRRASNRCQAEVEAAHDVTAVEAVQFAVTDADRATPQRLTRLEFLRRFTDDEMHGIVAAAEASPALKAVLLKWQAADGVVMTDPATIAGVQALEIAGLLAPGRADAILEIG